MVRIISSMALFIALIAFTLFTFAEKSSARIKGRPEWLLVAIPDAKIPAATERKARHLIAKQPLDQTMLNLIFAANVRENMSSERRDEFAKALNDLGWRDTSAQQNLILEAARNRDPQSAVLHADALLRRGKLVDEILPILVRLESFPEARALLIERLTLKPDWRGPYFRQVNGLSDPVMLDARVSLIDSMLAAGQPITHGELKPSLDALMRAGRRADAARLALRTIGKSEGTAPLYDPGFERIMAVSPGDRASPLPFEWETYSRPGISAQVAPRGNAGQLQLRWNGVGAPVLARTMVLMKEVHAARLEVVADDATALSALSRLRFGLTCPGIGRVAFLPVRADEARKTAQFQLGGPAPCDYPDFVVMGLPQARDVSVETSINAIRLVPD